ncbi:DUF6544 family protein [Leptospira bouyouniensis]|uniref:DUF6544 family protein n=1 Tax=Leptospira bouyouniensis TaxID=2484911 RepID=UPI003CC825FA
MQASMKGIPFRVYHSYAKENTTMKLKILSLFGVVEIKCVYVRRSLAMIDVIHLVTSQ